MPPYLRLVVPSACWNAPKIDSSWCSAMPMPVSLTRNMIAGPCSRTAGGSWSGSASSMHSSTPPVSVNFTALDTRLRSTCCRRVSSVTRSAGVPGAVVSSKLSPFWEVSGRNVTST